MNGTDVYRVLQAAGVATLHHANTVTTSCTFFQLGGLASRGYVADRHLPQTPQYSDDADKQLGIWYDIFTDSVDSHARGSIRNNYGPVLFLLPASILLNLPHGTEVLVTRKNPVHWRTGELPSDRYFTSLQELTSGYIYGEFGQHVILRNQDGFLPFSNFPLRLVLDDPQLPLISGDDAYANSVQKLQGAARAGNVTVQITKRSCSSRCRCLSGHTHSYDRTNLNLLF